MSFRSELSRGVPKGVLRFTKPKPQVLEALALPAADRALLEEGWPSSAAPSLSFDLGPRACVDVRARLEHVGETEHLAGLIHVGGDGGVLVCVERGTGRVRAVEHETGEVTYMNASLRALADAILAYAAAPKIAGRLQPSGRSALRERLAAIDAEALIDGRFWSNAVRRGERD